MLDNSPRVGGGGGGGLGEYYSDFLVGVFHSVIQTLTLLQNMEFFGTFLRPGI